MNCQDYIEPIDFTDPKYNLYDENGELMPTIDWSKHPKRIDPSEVQWTGRRLIPSYEIIKPPSPLPLRVGVVIGLVIGFLMGVIL